ncbi:hypothetical protein AVEN_85815-1 [Araneus ventricosus]|uniref:Uncharacterized protein n=1 Tax=Araneus ventricosus TaxID=182803 RepID=A0A4Y2PZZ3_ARAVE|nr:hypothetical protein AVEN_85815-1 [Araneus ventricosus]
MFQSLLRDKVRSRRTLPTHISPLPRGGFRVSFLASTRGPKVGRSFVLPLASQRGPQKAIPIRLQTIRNSTISIPRWQFSSVFKTCDCFFLPAFQKFESGATVNCLLNFHRYFALTTSFGLEQSNLSGVERS